MSEARAVEPHVLEPRVADPSHPDVIGLLSSYADELETRMGREACGARDPLSSREFGAPRGTFLVAYDGPTPVACGGLRLHAAPCTAEVKRLYVVPNARGQGLGRVMLEALERAARSLGHRRIVLDTAASLNEAARLYETHGYNRVPPFNDNRDADHWFAKDLPLDDDSLWGAFRHSSLPHVEWNHESHVRVAFLHVTRWELDEAHVRMRAGILRLNAMHGLEESPSRGYHETMTRLWLSCVRHACVADVAQHAMVTDSRRFCERHPELLDAKLPFRFYTRERLLSLHARAVYVPPDRETPDGA